eukprot:273053_1
MTLSQWSCFIILLSCYCHQMNASQNPTMEPTLEPILSMKPTIQPTIEPTESSWKNNKTIESLSCNETITGSTGFEGDITYYSLVNTNNENGTYFQMETYRSHYDTKLYLFDRNWNVIVFCDDCGNRSVGGNEQMNLPMKLYDDEYIIGVGRYSDDYGDYTLTIHCDL